MASAVVARRRAIRSGRRGAPPEVRQGLEVGEEVDGSALGHDVAAGGQLDEPLRRDGELPHERGGPGRLVVVVDELEGVGQRVYPRRACATSQTSVLLPLAWVPETTMRTAHGTAVAAATGVSPARAAPTRRRRRRRRR